MLHEMLDKYSIETLASWKADGRSYESVVETLELEGGWMLPLERRDWLVTEYAWAITDPVAIDYLVGLSPVYEVGAGSGYWAHRITEAGGHIIGFDPQEWKLEAAKIGIKTCKDWYPIFTDAPDIPLNATLFLCWPSFDEAWAHEALKAYKGKNVVYIGEPEGGCCADRAFHQRLMNEWRVVTEIEIPRFEAIRDTFTHYRRR